MTDYEIMALQNKIGKAVATPDRNLYMVELTAGEIDFLIRLLDEAESDDDENANAK